MLRRARLGLFALFALFSFACGGEPPTKEMHDAQVAIDAAKAVGADLYAAEEFGAAREALTRANEAVEQRDFRLALNHALDSRERAQNALTEAEGKRAAARDEAERAVNSARRAVNAAAERLKSADARAVARAQKPFDAAQQHLQEAITALGASDFVKSNAASVATVQSATSVTEALDAAPAAPVRRRR